MEKLYKETIPVFFAVDDKYAPYLAVTLRSMLAHADKNCFYRIHILITDLAPDYKEKLLVEQTENAYITFDDVSAAMENIVSNLPMRDYYSAATYYRIFIASLYPQYDRAFYFDSDLLFRTDIAAMYRTDLGGKVLGVITEDVMVMEPVFGQYAAVVIGSPVPEYFNAGILLIDLARYREENIEQRFLDLLGKRKFSVAQDQDYLNAICRGLVYYFPQEWNISAAPQNSDRDPHIVHYKMNWKPWFYDGIAFSDLFWQTANETAFAATLHDIKRAYTPAEKERDQKAGVALMDVARAETEEMLGYAEGGEASAHTARA